MVLSSQHLLVTLVVLFLVGRDLFPFTGHLIVRFVERVIF